MMIDVFDRLLWVYRAVFKQTNAGGGTIRVIFTAQERTLFLFGHFGPNDYAANRNIQGTIKDAGNLVIGQVLPTTAADNQMFSIPKADAAITSGGYGTHFNTPFLLARGESVVLDAVSLIQNEELTIAFKALVTSKQPFVTTTGSGGTVTVTTTYDKVI